MGDAGGGQLSPGQGDPQQGLEPIKVYCRFAPPPDGERPVAHALTTLPGGAAVVAVADDYNGTSVQVRCERAFDGMAHQAEVHQEVTLPLVPRFVSGYNVTLFAFGQTASGKTHTMLGPNGGRSEFLRDQEHCGLVPRTVLDVFEEVAAAQRGGLLPRGAQIDLSFFEVYNEAVSDLVGKATASGAGGNFSFRGTAKHRFDREVSRVCVSCAEECLHILEATLQARQLAGTELNEASSRGHSVVQLRLHGPGWRSTMSLVDLAGSECVKKSGAQGARRHEARNINTSLFALKQVIHALYKRKEHVPYGDSTLTRVLADSLGGGSHLRFLVCCTSRGEDAQETMQTLRFAGEASRVLRRAPGLGRPGGDECNVQLLPPAAAAELYQEVLELRARNAELDDRCNALQEQLLQAHDASASLVAQLQDRAGNRAAAHAQLRDSERELEAARADAAAARGELARQKQHSDSLAAKLGDALRRMGDITAQVQRVTGENEELREQLRQRQCPPDASARPAPPEPQRGYLAEDQGVSRAGEFLEEIRQLGPFDGAAPERSSRPAQPRIDPVAVLRERLRRLNSTP